MDVDPTVEDRIRAALEGITRDEYDVVAAGPATEEQIAALEADVGFRLRSDFRVFLACPLNGLAVLARTEIWPERRPLDVGPAWTSWPGLVIFGTGPVDLPGWARVGERLEQLRAEGVEDVLPVFALYRDRGRTWGLRADGRMVLVWSGIEVSPLDADFVGSYREEVVRLRRRTAEMVELRRSRGEL